MRRETKKRIRNNFIHETQKTATNAREGGGRASQRVRRGESSFPPSQTIFSVTKKKARGNEKKSNPHKNTTTRKLSPPPFAPQSDLSLEEINRGRRAAA